MTSVYRETNQSRKWSWLYYANFVVWWSRRPCSNVPMEISRKKTVSTCSTRCVWIGSALHMPKWCLLSSVFKGIQFCMRAW